MERAGRSTGAGENAADRRALFDEYLEGLARGAPPDLDELARRAGSGANELREEAALARDLGAALRLLALARVRPPDP